MDAAWMYDVLMRRLDEKPLYWENHESFRRLLIVGGMALVCGVFFFEGWLGTMNWVSGVIAFIFCFLLHPRQYSIYPDCLVVEWWYFRRKVVRYEYVTELLGSRAGFLNQLAVITRGPAPRYSFGYTSISPRKIEVFARRLEEALNRHRFYIGLEPITVERA